MPSLNPVAGIDLDPFYTLNIFLEFIGSSSAYFVLVLEIPLQGAIIASNALYLVPYGL